MRKKITLFLLMVIFTTSCVTNPITETNFSVRKKPPDIGPALVAGFVPGLAQFLNGEYLEGAVYAAAFAGSIAGIAVSSEAVPSGPDSVSLVPKPGYEVIAGLSIFALVSTLLASWGDALVTTWVRTNQYKDMLENTAQRRGNLAVKELVIDPLYAALYRSYRDHPVGRITLSNTSAEAIRNIRIFFEVKDYLGGDEESAHVASLSKNETREIELFAQFGDDLAAITESTPMVGEITVYYSISGTEFTQKKPVTFRIQHRNAFSWDNAREIVSFITPDDYPIVSFSRDTMAMFRSQSLDIDQPNLYAAMLIFYALGAYGCTYYPDPVTPFSEFSKTAEDAILYPRETLRYKSGDVDELSILYAALLESLDIPTALILGPEGIVSAFDTGVREDAYRQVAADKNLLVIHEGTVWLPVDLTEVGNSFLTAWEKAAQTVREWDSTGAGMIVATRGSWQEYPPVLLGETTWVPGIPEQEEINRLFSADSKLLVK